MITGEAYLAFAELAALAILSLSFLLTVVRVLRGPALPDRVVALDMLVAIAIGFIAVIGIKTGYTLYLDIAIALGLVGFLATVAFARFVMSRRYEEEFVSRDPLGIYRDKAE
ncbi:cation:proton antiporter [Chelativorans sp. J32]|jgi:Multisubunit Na+/H+ antiporter, MnhF subunit|uniref:cation:proton antiporter n=1 Tax=Chelativorans sp. J32 TaxID=935840 RepID=UPI000480BDFB|nr:cation:proton antiporter [Chelativorans sp. J32]